MNVLQGYTTYIMKQNWEMRSNSLIWSILRRHFSEEFVNGIRGMRMLKDKMVSPFKPTPPKFPNCRKERPNRTLLIRK